LFGIGWSELLVILAIALLVIGPKDLPRVLYVAGKFIRKIKNFTGDIQSSLDHIMREEELADITRQANQAGGDNLQFELDKQVEMEAARKRVAAEAAGITMSPLPEDQPRIASEDALPEDISKDEKKDASS
jgi:sec-independent protein translocase protein TatB